MPPITHLSLNELADHIKHCYNMIRLNKKREIIEAYKNRLRRLEAEFYSRIEDFTVDEVLNLVTL